MVVSALHPPPKNNHMDYRKLALEIVQEDPQDAHLLRLRVEGDSMVPAIQPGDTIVLEPVDMGELRVGDLVTVRCGHEVITHRIVRWRAGCFQIKGDNLGGLDRPLDPNELLGRVVAIERGGRRIRLDGASAKPVSRLLGQLSWWEARLRQAALGLPAAVRRGPARWGGRLFHRLFRFWRDLLAKMLA